MLKASGGNVKCLGKGEKKLRKCLVEWKIFCIFASCLGSQIHTEVWITDSHRDDRIWIDTDLSTAPGNL